MSKKIIIHQVEIDFDSLFQTFYMTQNIRKIGGIQKSTGRFKWMAVNLTGQDSS